MKIELKEPGSVDHELVWGLIGLLAILAAVFVPLDRIMADVGYECGFRRLTGYPCPSCGATRAWILVAALRFREAFRLSPLAALLFLGIVLYVPYALGTLVLRTRRVRITGVSRKGWRRVVLVLAALVMINWAYMIVQTHKLKKTQDVTAAPLMRHKR